MVAAARRHDDHVAALHHLRRLKARGEIADQDRTGIWMEGDGHQPSRLLLVVALTLSFMRLGKAHGIRKPTMAQSRFSFLSHVLAGAAIGVVLAYTATWIVF